MMLLAFQNDVFREKHKYRVEMKKNEIYELHIRNVMPADEGGYMCQINTNPMIAQIGHLALQGKLQRI